MSRRSVDPRTRADLQKNESGSVNSKGHFHAAHTVSSICKLLESYGLTEVHAELDGRLPVFPDEGEWPQNLVVRGQKSTSA